TLRRGTPDIAHPWVRPYTGTVPTTYRRRRWTSPWRSRRNIQRRRGVSIRWAPRGLTRRSSRTRHLSGPDGETVRPPSASGPRIVRPTTLSRGLTEVARAWCDCPDPPTPATRMGVSAGATGPAADGAMLSTPTIHKGSRE